MGAATADPARRSILARRLSLAGIALAALMTFLPLWSAGFVYEDRNDSDWAIQPWRGWTVETTNSWTWYSRPLTAVTMRADAWLGNTPRIYHATNVLLHLAVVAVVAALVWQMGGAWWLTAAILLLHPLTVESVAYISARGDLIATLAIAAAVALILADVPVVAFAVASLAFLAQPATAVALLGLIPLWRFARDRYRLSEQAEGVLIAGWLVWAVAVAIMLPTALQTPEVREAPMWGLYVGRQLAGVVDLAHLLVLPWPLVIDHGFGTFTPSTIWPLVGVGAAALYGAWKWRARQPWLFAALGIWVVGFGLRLVVPSMNYVTEHHAYLPLAGVAFCLGCAWA